MRKNKNFVKNVIRVYRENWVLFFMIYIIICMYVNKDYFDLFML